MHTYQYDGEGRLAKVDAGSANEASYFYDANNWRVKKVVGTGGSAVTTNYIWEGSAVIAEYSSTGPQGSGGTRYYHADRLSTRLITDGNGAVVGAEDHLPFGEDTGVTGESEKHRFTNYERDSESGTDYAVNRGHAPSLGRFMRPDPIAGQADDPQSLNRYAYTLNDPINLTDPLGLYEGCIHQAMSEFIANLAGIPADLAAKIGAFAGDGPGGADSPEFAATSLKNIAMPWKYFVPIHFPSDKLLDKYREALPFAVLTGQLQSVGFMMHAFEDGHGAHKKWRSIPFFTAWPLGHLLGGHRPDRIIGDQKFVDVANELLQILTGDANATLTAEQINQLIKAIVERCGKDKASKFKIIRRAVPPRVPELKEFPVLRPGNPFGNWNIFDLLHLLYPPAPPPPTEEDHLA